MTLPLRHLLAALALFAGLAAVPGSALAAQSYDNCTGFIDSVPATITTQGVWCLRKNLTASITSGMAITVAANNVTIDCNDFKIGGLGGGDSSNAFGIYAGNKQNVTVRHCNVRGFMSGISLIGGAGHLVEDNRLDNNLKYGIYMLGADNSLVQRNRVYDTGGHPATTDTVAIYVDADVIGNTVAGVFATANAKARGIIAGTAATIRNNRVRGFQASGTNGGYATGIYATDAGSMVDGNHVIGGGAAAVPGSAISGAGSSTSPDIACSNNVVGGFAGGINACVDAGGNTRL